MKALPSFEEIVRAFPALRGVGVLRRRRAIPFVQQLTSTECGVACLAMVLEYFGRTISIDRLRDIAISGRDATNAQALIETGRLFGLRGRAVTLDLDQMDRLDRAAILHWEFTHFVVFDRLTRTGVDIVDPKRGRWHVSMDRVRKSFTGVAIIFEPADDFTEGRRKRSTSSIYLSRVFSERGFIPHIVIATVLMQVLGLGIPLLHRVLIDTVIPNKDYSLFSVIVGAAAAIITLQTVSSFVRSHLLLYLRTRLDSRMTLAFFDHLLGLPFDFFQRRSAGDLLVRMSSNAAVREILTSSVLSGILDGSLASAYLLLLITLSPQIGLLAVVLALLQMMLFVATRNRQRQFLAQSLDSRAKSQGFLMETICAIETLKSLGAEHRAVEHWSNLFAAELNVSIAKGRLDAIFDAALHALRTTTTLALFALGVTQVMSGQLSLGEMMAVIAVASAFLAPVMGLVSAGSSLQVLTMYLERLNDVLEAPTEKEHSTSLKAPVLSGGISTEHISFRYSPITPWVVRDITTAIRPGEFVAIVGRSGSGKSTFARLLVGLYAPTEGRLIYDDTDLKDMDLARLRAQIGVVTQQAHLFAGTIKSNIALADPSLEMDSVICAAKRAVLHDDILAMPMGYDTALSDRGGSLSGGQQQRIALARALTRNPRILVLDEATSQLDSVTEEEVQRQLAAIDCTRIVIAHRLSTIMKADRILVLEKGHLVEEGTHNQLLANNKGYATLVAAQARNEAPTSSWPMPSNC